MQINNGKEAYLEFEFGPRDFKIGLWSKIKRAVENYSNVEKTHKVIRIKLRLFTATEQMK